MEFFAEIKDQSVSASQIAELVTIPRLPELCESIDSVIAMHSQRDGEIYCIWGQFQISREKIRNGVRIALLNCPHALAWTIAAKSEETTLVVHCTIDDRDAESEFVESIEQFVNDWEKGLRKVLPE